MYVTRQTIQKPNSTLVCCVFRPAFRCLKRKRSEAGKLVELEKNDVVNIKAFLNVGYVISLKKEPLESWSKYTILVCYSDEYSI